MNVIDVSENDFDVRFHATKEGAQTSRWIGRDVTLPITSNKQLSDYPIGLQKFDQDSCVRTFGKAGVSVDVEDGKIEAEGHVEATSDDGNTTVEAHVEVNSDGKISGGVSIDYEF